MVRTVSLLAAVALATAAAGCGSTAAHTPAAGAREGLAVPWKVFAVREHGRVLELRYRAGGCLRGDGRAVVTESRTRVMIQVREHQSDASDNERAINGCSQVLLLNKLHVRLRAPLAGRPIIGGPRLPKLTSTSATQLPS